VSHGGNASGNIYNGAITSTTVTSFSPFTLGSSSVLNPLPVTLISFNAKYIRDYIEIKWSSANEQFSDYYSLEKSIDGLNWFEISKHVSSNQQQHMQHYESVDMNPVDGVQYYRLKQVDISGRFVYTSPVSVRVEVSPTQIIMYPNPVVNSLHLKLDPEKLTDILIRNSLGQIVYQLIEQYGNTTVDVKNLTNGVYTIETLTEGTITSGKLIKN
jgi:hypothetical protein